MKTSFSNTSRVTRHAPRSTLHVSRARERGIAVLSVLALVAIVMVYVAANVRTLHSLDGELKLVERRQIHRLKVATPAAHSPSVTNSTPSLRPAQK